MDDALLKEFINESRDGSLIIGSTESFAGLCPEFEPKRYLRAVFYHLK